MMKKKVCLFGASQLGEIAFQQLNSKYEIIYFIDNSKEKHGTFFCDHKIISPAEACKMEDICIIISSTYDIEIAKQLIDMGIKSFGVFTITHEKYHVSFFDYYHINDFSINKNKICLLVQNYSGSNTFCLSKHIPKSISDTYEVSVLHKGNLTPSYYYDLITSYVMIATHDYRCAVDQINIQLWHGIPLKGISYMSNYPYQDAEANHEAWSKLDYIGSSSQTVSTLLNACFGATGSKYRILGYPRNDFLFANTSKIKLKTILRQDIADQKVIFYMPTYRKNVYGESNGESSQLISQLETKKLEAFNQFLSRHDFILCIKQHPEELKLKKQYSHIYTLLEEDLEQAQVDLYELLGAADLLITDYSSVYFDYLLLDRPVVFFTPDLEKYSSDRGFLLNPMEYWLAGEIISSLDSLQYAIINAIDKEDRFKQRRRELAKVFHHYQDNKAAERTWDFIDQLLQDGVSKERR